MLAIYEQAITMTPEAQKAWGINPRVLTQVKVERQRLAVTMEKFVNNWRSLGERDDLIFCLVSGLLDCIYRKSLVRDYRDYPQTKPGIGHFSRQTACRLALEFFPSRGIWPFHLAPNPDGHRSQPSPSAFNDAGGG
ncbi:MAG: hypothetical protein PHV97_03475 [Candidatus Omnitrophica bacterium]|nr:hypothetical protein [Candidatus Omnitrophota bacterium]